MQPELEHALEEDLERYSLGILPADATEVLEEHLLTCPQCQDRLAETDVYVRTMQRTVRKLRAQSGSQRNPVSGRPFGAHTMPRLAWSLAAAVFIVVILWAAGAWRLASRSGTSPVAVVLQVARGGEAAGIAAAPKRQALKLQADLSGLSPAGEYMVAVVDREGSPVMEYRVKAEGSWLTLELPNGLESGNYWVRLRTAESQNEGPLREYGLSVR